jgi:hypothetical protein
VSKLCAWESLSGATLPTLTKPLSLTYAPECAPFVRKLTPKSLIFRPPIGANHPMTNDVDAIRHGNKNWPESGQRESKILFLKSMIDLTHYFHRRHVTNAQQSTFWRFFVD